MMQCVVCGLKGHVIYFLVNDKHNLDPRGDVCERCHSCKLARCGSNTRLEEVYES